MSATSKACQENELEAEASQQQVKHVSRISLAYEHQKVKGKSKRARRVPYLYDIYQVLRSIRLGYNVKEFWFIKV